MVNGGGGVEMGVVVGADGETGVRVVRGGAGSGRYNDGGAGVVGRAMMGATEDHLDVRVLIIPSYRCVSRGPWTRGT